MNLFIILCLIFIGIYSCVSWLVTSFCIVFVYLANVFLLNTFNVSRLLPALLAWLFKRKYHIKLKIGRIAVPKLVFKDVNLSTDGYSIVSKLLIFFNLVTNRI